MLEIREKSSSFKLLEICTKSYNSIIDYLIESEKKYSDMQDDLEKNNFLNYLKSILYTDNDLIKISCSRCLLVLKISLKFNKEIREIAT